MFLGLAVCVFLCYSLDHLFQRCLLLLCWVFVSSVPSQEIGWEAHLNMTYSMSSGTWNLNSINSAVTPERSRSPKRRRFRHNWSRLLRVDCSTPSPSRPTTVSTQL